MVKPALCLLLAACLLLARTAAADYTALPWKEGRATYYGEPGDKWSIHDGSCTHTYQWPDVVGGAAGGQAGRRELQAALTAACRRWVVQAAVRRAATTRRPCC